MRTGQVVSHTSREDVENGVERIPKGDGIRTFYYFLTLVQNVDQGGCAGILGVIDFSIETNTKKKEAHDACVRDLGNGRRSKECREEESVVEGMNSEAGLGNAREGSGKNGGSETHHSDRLLQCRLSSADYSNLAALHDDG